MPVFTAAIASVAAVSAAVGTAATIAAVATAVVTVSAAIGVVGLGLSVVGAVTGDKTLSSIGKYMGYAGIAGGLAGAAIGGIGALSAGGEFLAGATAPFESSAALMDQAWKESAVNPSNLFGLDANSTTQLGSQTPIAGDAAIQAADKASLATGPPIGEGTPGFDAANAAAPTGPAPSGPGPSPITPQAQGYVPTTPDVATINAPAVPGATPSPTFTLSPNQTTGVTPGTGILGLNPTPGAGLAQITENPNTFGKWFESLDSFQKHAVLTGGSMALQGLGGAAQGMFAGATAEERLNFDRMVNTQRQAQLLLENQRSGSTPGVVSFNQNRPVRPAGMISV